jgi:hypothetical protein
MEWPWTKEPDQRFCRKCGTVAVPRISREITSGQWAGLVVLLVCGIIPGLIYGLHLATGGGARRIGVCPSCGGRGVTVPLDSPVAKAELAALEAKR